MDEEEGNLATTIEFCGRRQEWCFHLVIFSNTWWASLTKLLGVLLIIRAGHAREMGLSEIAFFVSPMVESWRVVVSLVQSGN